MNYLIWIWIDSLYFVYRPVQEFFHHVGTLLLPVKFARCFEQGGIFIVPRLLWHVTFVYTVSTEGRPRLVDSKDKPRSLRTYSNLDHYVMRKMERKWKQFLNWTLKYFSTLDRLFSSAPSSNAVKMGSLLDSEM